MAHFHEHMLFLGTEKYPKENDYETFLSKYGGFSNAYTDMEDTNYYFSLTTTAPKSNKFPKSIWYIVGNEAAERFNFYGLRAILTTFMVAQFYNHSGSTDPNVVAAAEATASAKTHDFDASGNETHTDYVKMMQIVKKAKFKGYVGIEYEGQKTSEKEGIKLTKALLEKVGKMI